MSEAVQAAQETPTAATETSASAPVTDPAPKAPEASAPATAAAKPAEAASAQAPDASKAEPAKDSAETAKQEPETKPAEAQKPVVPEKYDLKMPKDSALSDAHVENLSLYAKEKGLSNEQAQELLERESKAVSEYSASVYEKQKQMADGWAEQASKDAEIGGEAFKQNAELAKRVVERFATDDFRKELSKTGLGNHPELLRIFTRIGKAMAPDTLIPGGQRPPGQKKTTEEILYGNSSKEN